MKQIDYDEYVQSVNEVVFEEITAFASQLASKLIKAGKSGDTPIITEKEIREVPGKIEYRSYKKITTTKKEKFVKVKLKGWTLRHQITDFENDFKILESTIGLYLGEDGFLYSGEDKYWQPKNNPTDLQHEIIAPTKLTSTGDFRQWDLDYTISTSRYTGYRYYFGGGVTQALKNLIKDLEISIGKVYYIKSKNSGLYLDAIGPEHGYGNGNVVGQWEYTGRDNQKWKVIKGNKGYYKLMNLTGISGEDEIGGKVIDIDGGQNDDGTIVHMWENSNQNHNQDLIFESKNDGTFIIKTAASNGTKCLDIIDWGKTSGSLVHQWTNHGGDNQLWYFEVVSE